MKDNLNYIQLTDEKVGNARRREMLNDILKNGTFLPKTVEYKDIDEDFKRWVEKEMRIVSDEGIEFPTMVLYSNQRFSEYSQSWEYTDANNNLLLNFKTVTRENNPEYGKIQNGFWNIPGDRFYLMKREIVQDENGTESFRDLKMKQPVAINLSYKVSIFTTKFQKINEFNTLMNKAFSARQCYIHPNSHYMPMILESISDESEYVIDDREFYSQSYTIRVMGYIITEDDYRVEERPLKNQVSIKNMLKSKKADVEIDEEVCPDDIPPSTLYYKPITLTIKFPTCTNKAKFTIDTDFVCNSISVSNVFNNYKIFVNSESTDNENVTFKENDVIEVRVTRKRIKDEAIFIMNGYSPNEIYDEKDDEPEIELDEKNYMDEYEYEAED